MQFPDPFDSSLLVTKQPGPHEARDMKATLEQSIRLISLLLCWFFIPLFFGLLLVVTIILILIVIIMLFTKTLMLEHFIQGISSFTFNLFLLFFDFGRALLLFQILLLPGPAASLRRLMRTRRRGRRLQNNHFIFINITSGTSEMEAEEEADALDETEEDEGNEENFAREDKRVRWA